MHVQPNGTDMTTNGYEHQTLLMSSVSDEAMRDDGTHSTMMDGSSSTIVDGDDDSELIPDSFAQSFSDVESLFR
jgi:hypothetical protein